VSGQDAHAGFRRNRLERLPQEMHGGIRELREHLERPGEIELRQAREQQQADADCLHRSFS
jgi:hypothetical protein